jgi:hypothetical protein
MNIIRRLYNSLTFCKMYGHIFLKCREDQNFVQWISYDYYCINCMKTITKREYLVHQNREIIRGFLSEENAVEKNRRIKS